jgi:hypothetical protein
MINSFSFLFGISLSDPDQRKHRLRAKERIHSAFVDWSADVVALYQVAAVLNQILHLLFMLHTFRNLAGRTSGLPATVLK